MRVYYLNLFKLSRKLVAFGAVAIAAFLFVIIMQQNIPITSRPGGQVIDKVHTRDKALALTFNVETGTDVTPIIEALEQQEVKATFFIAPAWAHNNPQVTNRLSLKGHEAGIFLDTSYYRELSSLNEYMEKSKETFRRLTGNNPTLVRFQKAKPDAAKISSAYSRGYQIIGGTYLSPEELSQDPDWLQQGNILSLTLQDPSGAAEQVNKIGNLLKKNEYSAVTVSNLLTRGPGISG